MKTVIYLDSLLLVNFVIGYFLLRAAGCVCGAPPRWPRGCLGAALAAVSTLILLAPPLPVWAQFLYQGGSALAITAAAFGWQGARLLLRRAAWYFGMNLALAGLVLAAILRFSAQNVQTNNLAVYWNVPPLLLLFCSLGVYLLARLAVLLFGPAEPCGARRCGIRDFPGTIHFPAARWCWSVPRRRRASWKSRCGNFCSGGLAATVPPCRRPGCGCSPAIPPRAAICCRRCRRRDCASALENGCCCAAG